MAGVVASSGDWSALYPIPALGSSEDNPGLSMHSFAKSKWSLLCRLHHVPDYTHFILPPPSALLFIPLSWTTFPRAFWIWTAILTGCAWGVAWVSGALLRCIMGRPTRYEGVLALLIAVSPVTARAIRIANVSPPIALLIGVGMLLLIRGNRPARVGLAMLVGALLKYATLILAPLLLALRRWHSLLWLAALGATVLALSLLIQGTAPYIEFYKTILPTLSRPSWFYGNQSLPGLLSRVYGRPFPDHVNFLLSTARIGSMGVVIGSMLSLKKGERNNPVMILAGAAALVSWLLVFSPIAWEHWTLFLAPFWGWLLWEAQGSIPRRIVVTASWALMYFPAGIIQVPGWFRYPIVLDEPYNSTQLIGVVLCFLLGFWRLSAGGSGRLR